FLPHGTSTLFATVAPIFGLRDRDRSVTCWGLAPRPAGIAEHALRQTRKVYQVLVDEGISGSCKTCKPVLDVGCVTRFRHFTVTDYGNARLSLLGHNSSHGGTNLGGKQRLLDWLSFLFGVH